MILPSRSPRAALNRRRFLQHSALTGALALTVGRLAGARTHAAPAINPYPMGTKPVADNIEGAVKFWLDAMKDAEPDTSPDVVLTPDEVAELKSMKPKVGHTWYGFFVPAIEGWNRFWEKGVSEWAASHTSFDVQGKPDRDIAGVQLMIQQQIPVIGTLAVDWVVFSEAMRKMHDAGVASTSVVAPSSAYFPTTSTIMPDQTENARDLVLPMAKKLAAEGIREADIVLLTIKTPAFFDIARVIGFKEGVKSSEIQAICKLNIIAEKPVAAGVEEAQAATAAALQQYPKVHVIAALGHWYAGASAAIRDAGRKDAWVVAFDLDRGTAADLLTGGWPVYTTYSLPIAQTGRADANVMGKFLLGKPVPLIVRTTGKVTTPDNVAQSWSDNWGGEKIPF
jgi:ABC-type sugar transport system substrate-binding protein